MNTADKITYFHQLVNKHLPSYNQEIEVYQGSQSGYRQRAEFSIYHDNNDPYSVHHVTFDKKTKQRLFWDQGFPLASDLINSLIMGVNKFMSDNYEFSYKLFQAEYLTSLSGQAIVSLIFHRQVPEEQAQEYGKKLQEFLIKQNYYPNNQDYSLYRQAGIEAKLSIIIRARKSLHITGDNYITELLQVNNRQIKLRQVENSFSQPNALVNQMMLSYIDKHVKTNKDILELYCGVGNFTMVLTQLANKVLATEVNKQAIDFARQNIKLNNITNLDLGRISAEEFVQAINKVRPFKRLKHLDLDSYDFDTVFVDPPRSGLDDNSLDMISRYPQIAYVSCNPETLMPNLEYLTTKHGFTITNLAIFDQFPQTPHLESIALLVKNI